MEYNWVLLCQVSSIVLGSAFSITWLGFCYLNSVITCSSDVSLYFPSTRLVIVIVERIRYCTRRRHRRRLRSRHKEYRYIHKLQLSRRSVTFSYEWASLPTDNTRFIYSHQSVSVCLWIIYFFILVTTYCRILCFYDKFWCLPSSMHVWI